MTRPSTTLLLTRPKAASEAFLSELNATLARDIPAVISPVLRIVDNGPLPDLSDVGTIILTSGHAVARLGEAGLLSGRRVATVGAATAEAARRYGAQAETLGPDAERLLAAAQRLKPPCLHCRGVHTRGDIAARLTRHGIPTTDTAIYDQVAQPLNVEARALLAGPDRVLAPVFSPRSAEILAAETPGTAAITVVAISPAAAAAWTGPGNVKVAENPSAEAMLEAVAAQI